MNNNSKQSDEWVKIRCPRVECRHFWLCSVRNWTEQTEVRCKCPKCHTEWTIKPSETTTNLVSNSSQKN